MWTLRFNTTNMVHFIFEVCIPKTITELKSTTMYRTYTFGNNKCMHAIMVVLGIQTLISDEWHILARVYYNTNEPNLIFKVT